MHKAIIEWVLDASGFMMGLAVWVFPLVLVTTAVLVIFRRTRPWGVGILCSFWMLVVTAMWFFGAVANFASFGWVFPLVLVTTAVLVIFRRTRPWGVGILFSFWMLANFGWFGLIVGLLPSIIILLVATFAGDNESKVGPLTPDQKQAEAKIGRIFDESEFSNDPVKMEALGIELGLFKQADEDLKAADNEVEVVDPVANTPAQERGRIPGESNPTQKGR